MTLPENVHPITNPAPPIPSNLWRNRDYLLLWSGQAVSRFGSAFSGVALPFLILALTGSPQQTGIAFALGAVPYLVFSLPAGALIDRWDRKRVMIICDTGRALAIGSIPVALLLGHLTILQIDLALVMDGSLFVFFNIAEIAALPRVVNQAQLTEAMGYNQGVEYLGGLVGPPLGGALFGLSQVLPFFIDAVSYTASVLSLFAIRARFQVERAASEAPGHLLREISEGIRWLWQQRLVRFLAFTAAMINFILGGSFLITILRVRELLPADQRGALPFITGLIFGFSSVGGVIGSALARRVKSRVSIRVVAIGSLWIWSILWLTQAIAPNVIVLAAINLISPLLGPLYNAVIIGYRLALIPDALQGRVNSAIRFITFGLNPLGAVVTGVVLQRTSAVPAILGFGAIYVLVAVMVSLNRDVRAAH